jgi:fibronectin-binding autotransporter adhesin
MRRVSSRVVTLWIAILCFVAAFSSFDALASAQAAAGTKRKPLQPSLSLAPAEGNLVSAGAATSDVATTDTWTGGGGSGNIKWSDASNWNSGAITSGENILINLTTAATDVDTSFTIGTLTLSNAGDSATILNGVQLTVEGNISNNGTITLGSTGGGAYLQVGTSAGGQNITLSGSGTLKMSNGAISGGAETDTLTNEETIQGGGTIGTEAMTFVNSGTINSSTGSGITISASGGVTNTGTIEATTANLLLDRTEINNTGGTISASAFALQLVGTTITGGAVTLTGSTALRMSGSEITGGTLTNGNGLIEILSGSNTLGGTIINSPFATFKIDGEAELTLLPGTYAQLGTVQVNGSETATELQVGTSAGGTNVTLSGGAVVMSQGNHEVAPNYIFGVTATDTLTNEETISGSGYIGNGQLTLVNSGTIHAYGSGMTINANGGITNTGTIEATLTGGCPPCMVPTLLFEDMGPQAGTKGITNTGGTILDNATTLEVTNTTITGGAVTLTPTATLEMNNSTIQGATLTNSTTGIIESVGNNSIIDATTVQFKNVGTLEANGGTLTIEGPGTTFFTNDNQTTNTLTGGSYVANGTNIQWAAGAGGIKTLAASVTEENGGQLMNTTNSTNVLAGLTSITSTGALTIGGLAFTDAGGFNNAGSLTILSGESFKVGTLTQISGGSLTAGTYVLDANLNLTGATQTITTNAATLTLAGGTIENANSTNALAGLAANTGALTIGGIAFTDAGAFSNSGSLTILSGSSFKVGTLTEISGGSLTAGTYVLDANLNLTGATQTITTNAATLTLAGGTIENANSTNALAGLATNTGNLTVAGSSNNLSTTAASFSSTGTLTINLRDSFTAAKLAQISGSTLSGGTFVLGGSLDLATSGISVTTNSATLTLQGGTINSNGVNALAALASNTKSLTIAEDFSTAATSFSNTGTLTINAGSFTAAALTQISGTTLSGGTYVLGGNLVLTAAENITTNSAVLTLEGGTITTGGTNDLAHLSSNTGSLTLANRANFTLVNNNFTNSGALTIDAGSTFTLFQSSLLTNLVGGTLTGGTYTVGGTLLLTAANGGITTNAANLTLTGSAAKILNGEVCTTCPVPVNALTGFDSNTSTGTFTLAGNAVLTTAAANFADAGTLDVAKGSTLTVGGTGNSYNQTGGKTTIDGTLAGISDATVTGGTILGTGTVKGNLSVGNGSGTAATINVGDSGVAGLLSITGKYTQLATGTTTGTISGTAAGTGYSQLKVTGAAALAGTINFTVTTAFQASLALGEKFTVLTASAVTGTFSNATIAINSTFEFTVSYTSTGVVLTVAATPSERGTAQTATASAKPAVATVVKRKNPVAIGVGGVRRVSSTERLAAGKMLRPIAEWEHSKSWLTSESEVNGLRSWERIPTVHAWPVAAAPLQRPVNETVTPSQPEPGFWRTRELRPIEPPLVSRTNMLNIRREPVRILSPMLPRTVR